MEIELPNASYRLKPGMYSRVRLTTAERPNALVVPRNAVVDTEGTRGIFLFDAESQTARFRTIEVGLQDETKVEVLNGVREGEPVITTGATALSDGDPVLLPGTRAGLAAGRGPQGAPGRTGAASQTPEAGPPAGCPLQRAQPRPAAPRVCRSDASHPARRGLP